MRNKEIHSFWLEGDLTDINLLTIRSFQDKGHKFIIHGYDSNLTKECEIRDASEVLPKSDWKYYTGLASKFRLGLIGDTLRARLLYKYGGVHVDLDVTCLKPIDFEEEYVFRPHNLGVVMNFVKCPPRSQFAQHYIDYTNSVDVNKNDWCGSFAGLIEGIKRYNLEPYIKTPEVLGMDEREWWKPLLQKNHPPRSEYIIHWCNTTGLNNNYIKGCYYQNLLKQYGLRETSGRSYVEYYCHRGVNILEHNFYRARNYWNKSDKQLLNKLGVEDGLRQSVS